MRTRTFWAWLCLMLLICWPGFISGQSDSEVDVRAVAKNVEEGFKACPRREVVAQFDRKHHKKVWQKQAWGPPTNVFVDVKPNDSLLYPYLVVVEFSLPHTFGPERQSKEDAQNDAQLEAKLGELLTLTCRDTYLVGKDNVRVKSREFLPIGSTWRERSLWSDACWDHIAVKQASE